MRTKWVARSSAGALLIMGLEKQGYRGTSKMKYECPCGYVYDPEEGDDQAGITGGTPFDDLPEGWLCPKCAAEKQYFEPLED